MHYITANVNDKIWVFWDKEFNGTILDHDEQQMTLELRHVEAGELFHVCNSFTLRFLQINLIGTELMRRITLTEQQVVELRI